MIDRLLLAAAIIVAALILYYAFNRSLLARKARAALRLDAYRFGTPAILYFTGPDCLPCRTIQRPALEELSSMYASRLQIIEVDVTEYPELADAWGVLSLPTTFIIDKWGQPRGVNHGAARAERLVGQLEKIGATPGMASSAHRAAPGLHE